MSDGVVILGFGPQPMDFFGKATKVCGKDAVISPDVARMAGANLAAGTPAALAKLRARLEAGMRADVMKSYPYLPPSCREWIATGERGVSSETLFQCLAGIKGFQDRPDHPYDPADFARCRKMLEQCHDLQEWFTPSMIADLGPVWRALYGHWNELCATMDAEAPEWRAGIGSCPKTAALIREIIQSTNN